LTRERIHTATQGSASFLKKRYSI